MKTSKYSLRLSRLGGSLGGLVILAVILVAVNVIVGTLNLRQDLTQEKLFTLSDGTRHVLQKLDRTVTLKFFFTSSAAEIPVPLKSFAREVQELLHEYELASAGRIAVEVYDPKPDSDAEDWAQRYGVTGEPLGLSGVSLYLGLAGVCGDQQAAIPMLDPRNEQTLEYSITRMIYRLGAPQKPVVGILSPLPVMGMPALPFMMPGQPRPEPRPAWAAFQALRDDYTVREVPLTAESIDPDIDALVIVHPKNLSDRALYAIDQFVLRGGRLIACVDPFCVVDNSQPESPEGAYAMPARSSDMAKLFAAWDVGYAPAKLAADMDAATYLRGRDNQAEQSPVYLSLRAANLSRNDILTASLESMVLPLAGSFTCTSTDKLKATPLIVTSERAQSADAMMAQFDPGAFLRTFKSGLKPLTLAVRLQGKFKTAFPEGRPPAAPDAEGKTKPEEPVANSLQESTGSATVILIGDVDFLNDQFTVEQQNFFGSVMQQPINDNISFFLNAVEQMAGSTDLIGIRSRGTAVRPFDRVLALEHQAQERWMEQERAIEEKLQATQQRLAELQNTKDEKQRFILSPEQQKEIERFRQESLNYRQELKQVRRNLREGIESLGVKVKVLNILLVPALVAFGGIGFGLYRRSRSTR